MPVLPNKKKEQFPTELQTPFACDLTVMSPKERDGYRQDRTIIFDSVQQTREMPDGYAFRLQAESSMIVRVARWIGTERLCCPFFGFTIEIEREHGPIWLRINGGAGAKDFMKEEFGIDALMTKHSIEQTGIPR